MKTYLNLGCGHCYHKEWTNVDFVSINEFVLAHNLLKGVPFENESFSVVYHSHVLEHFSKSDGHSFLDECYRVLKKEGIIRVVIPDLEKIVRNYLQFLEQGIDNPKDVYIEENYDWTMLEMYDQVVRNKSGGDMINYIIQENNINDHFVFDRLGEEAKKIRELNSQFVKNNNFTDISNKPLYKKIVKSLKNRINTIKGSFTINSKKTYLELGRFRLSGEIHQWMYDRYSLGKALEKVGFTNIKVKTAFESDIAEWNKFNLDGKDNIIRKPDSLFIEAYK